MPGVNRRKRTQRFPAKRWTPVIVEWVDALQHYGDHKLSELDSDLPVRRSIGFLVYRDRHEIRLCSTDDRSWSEPDAASETLRVPLVLIKNVTPLKEPRRAAA